MDLPADPGSVCWLGGVGRGRAAGRNPGARSDYATLWWKLGLLGIGIGFMFAPLTVAVISATPAARAGLGSSVLNTFRLVGFTLGAAVLGTFVLLQFSGNIASQLVQRGVSGA